MCVFPKGKKAAYLHNFITGLGHCSLFQPIKITITAGDADGTPFCGESPLLLE